MIAPKKVQTFVCFNFVSWMLFTSRAIARYKMFLHLIYLYPNSTLFPTYEPSQIRFDEWREQPSSSPPRKL
ncbi:MULTISPECIES: glycine-rich domain-containing protein [Nostocales]|uniref:Uncharacterized protein n=3 Tax=Nostocales TaxID=1161 RepID=A0A0C1R2S6_9CYAN|nr:hypothetical protein [Tolypothrix bouteillei]KAF3884057.1 hypothetical protein DA73_0400035105 [Tolypothrix bouteillei VB521301]